MSRGAGFPMRVGLAVALAAGMVAAGGCGSVPGDETVATAEKGRSLYGLEFSEEGVDGRRFSTAAQRGKVVMVNLFATWCPPCQRETPYLVELYKKHGGAGLEIVMVSTEDGETVRGFAEQRGVPFAVIADRGGKAVMAKVPNFVGYPTTAIIDREGNVRYQIIGFQEGALARAVEALLAE